MRFVTNTWRLLRALWGAAGAIIHVYRHPVQMLRAVSRLSMENQQIRAMANAFGLSVSPAGSSGGLMRSIESAVRAQVPLGIAIRVEVRIVYLDDETEEKSDSFTITVQ